MKWEFIVVDDEGNDFHIIASVPESVIRLNEEANQGIEPTGDTRVGDLE
jgi:hypothetical protein